MATDNSQGSIIQIKGIKGYDGSRLHVSPDPQDELVLRDHVIWQFQRCYWVDLKSLCNLPHGKADVR